jgi:hypothetical protein
MKKEVACTKTLKCTNKDQIKNLGRYLDIVKSKWINKNKMIVKRLKTFLFESFPIR